MDRVRERWTLDDLCQRGRGMGGSGRPSVAARTSNRAAQPSRLACGVRRPAVRLSRKVGWITPGTILCIQPFAVFRRPTRCLRPAIKMRGAPSASGGRASSDPAWPRSAIYPLHRFACPHPLYWLKYGDLLWENGCRGRYPATVICNLRNPGQLCIVVVC